MISCLFRNVSFRAHIGPRTHLTRLGAMLKCLLFPAPGRKRNTHPAPNKKGDHWNGRPFQRFSRSALSLWTNRKIQHGARLPNPLNFLAPKHDSQQSIMPEVRARQAGSEVQERTLTMDEDPLPGYDICVSTP